MSCRSVWCQHFIHSQCLKSSLKRFVSLHCGGTKLRRTLWTLIKHDFGLRSNCKSLLTFQYYENNVNTNPFQERFVLESSHAAPYDSVTGFNLPNLTVVPRVFLRAHAVHRVGGLRHCLFTLPSQKGNKYNLLIYYARNRFMGARNHSNVTKPLTPLPNTNIYPLNGNTLM